MKSEDLKSIVKEKYGKIAEQNGSEGSCCSSSSCCGSEVDNAVFSENYESKDGYNPEADLNLGCGIPTDFANIKKGNHVLDLGSGAGNDCFVARALVGESGKVTGLDMTEPMIKKARENCSKMNFKNVDFVLGDIENLPFENDRFDVVISNCVLNLVPDKLKAFNEVFRVLNPGGRFCVSDVVIKGNLSEKMKKDAEMYVGCVSGAIEMSEYLGIIKQNGFHDIRVHKQKEISLPYELLTKYLTSDELGLFGNGKAGIYSITISGCK